MEKFERFDAITRIRNNSHFEKSTKQWAANPRRAKQAFEKICDMWNKDEKSRAFLKHIIAAFLPYQPMNKIINFEGEMGDGKFTDKYKQPVCAILGLRLMGIKTISHYLTTFGMKRMFINAKMITDKRNVYTAAEKKELDDYINEIPIEARTSSFAYFSDSSDKYLSKEAMVALLRFVELMIFEDNQEINFTIKKRRLSEYNNEFPKEKKLKENQINNIAKITTYGMGQMLNNKSFESLQKLKELLKSEENEKAEKNSIA